MYSNIDLCLGAMANASNISELLCWGVNGTYDVYLNFGDTINRNNTSQTLLDELNDRDAATLLPLTILLGVFGIVGIVGNIFVFIVYGCGKEFKDRKFRYFVLSLACINFLTCLTLIPAEILKHRNYFNFTERYFCKIKCSMNVFAASGASYCMTLVAVDRYILTCRPVLCNKVPKVSNDWARRLCLIMLLMAVLTSIPAAVLCGITSDVITDVRGYLAADIYACEIEPYFEDGIARYVYRISLCAIQILVSLVMIVLYAKIGHTVSRAMHIREDTDQEIIEMYDYRAHVGPRPRASRHQLVAPAYGQNNDEYHHHHHHHHHHIPNNIKLLFIVTIVFIATYLIYLSLSWIDQKHLSQTQFLVFSMFYRSYFVHSIINPILYLKMDKHFRERCRSFMKKLFCIETFRTLCHKY
ncbi:alpha-1A adrenergic receptor-like [Mya arenaria]|uniref:alpha-1A adrenergic receptor-like n=1 Tax=Mya arenaria TaxID=6604 RepID=UPI0022E4777F|nr:alpha-1A adrenergic receptor-like [Mya arenaria]